MPHQATFPPPSALEPPSTGVLHDPDDPRVYRIDSDPEPSTPWDTLIEASREPGASGEARIVDGMGRLLAEWDGTRWLYTRSDGYGFEGGHARIAREARMWVS